MSFAAFHGAGHLPLLDDEALSWSSSMRAFLRSYDSPGFVVQDFRMIDDRSHVLLCGRPVLYIIANEIDFIHLEWCIQHGGIFLSPLDATWIAPKYDYLRERYGWLWDHAVTDPAEWIEDIGALRPSRGMENLLPGFRELDKKGFAQIVKKNQSFNFDTYTDVVRYLGNDRSLASVFLDKTSSIDADGSPCFTPTILCGSVEDFVALGSFSGETTTKVILTFCLPPQQPIEFLLQQIREISSNLFILHKILVYGYQSEGAIGSIHGELLP